MTARFAPPALLLLGGLLAVNPAELLAQTASVEYLIVAGGGGGGHPLGEYGVGGGGGGGGVLTGSMAIAPGSYPVVVGSGGGDHVSGQNSSFNGLIAIGGGAGGNANVGGASGGSGGGGGARRMTFGGLGGAGTAGQGGNGGTGSPNGDGACAGGGGGAYPAAGGNAYYVHAGKGGAGRMSSISGTPITYGGGGGGGGEYNCWQGTGTDGGADGGYAWFGGHAVANRGGGGGGGSSGGAWSGGGGSGGSGIVIIRYPVGSLIAGGGSVTTAGGYRIHTFVGSDIFVVSQPAPTLSSVSPSSAKQGASVSVTLSGTNFVSGSTTVAVSGSGVSVSAVAVTTSTSLTATFAVGGSAAAGTRTVTVTTAGGTSGSLSFTVAVNSLPTIALASPGNGATFTAPADITVSANASDSDGSVARVEFYSGGTLLATDTAAPYAFSWNGVGAGTYSVTARATDDLGASATTTVATVTVSLPPDVAPSVTLTEPLGGASYSAPATMTLSAAAADSDGSIASVEFYSGATLLATDTTSPYAYIWSGVAAGSYSLTARAIDNVGVSTTSTPVAVTVVPNSPPSISLTSLGNGVSVEYLIVAGGGGGGHPLGDIAPNGVGGGGGGGGVLTGSVIIGGGSHPVIVGNGGGDHASGENSSFNGLIAIGGGAGGNADAGGASGGSGGGGGSRRMAFSGAGGAGTAGQGANGGAAYTNGDGACAGGGGGAYPAGGGNAYYLHAGNGGAGRLSSISGTPITYGGGGGGGGEYNCWQGTGTDGGADGGYAWFGGHAVANRGGGGGGGSASPTSSGGGGSGGSGIVIIRYPAGSLIASGGSVTTGGDYQIHTFTGSGTLDVSEATFTAPAMLTLTALASDPDGSIERVEFFSGASLIATLTAAPYTYEWSNVAAGTYSITARATDNAGEVTTSAPSIFVVDPPLGVAPSIAFTSPASGATFTAPATITLAVSATDPDGTIAKVEFFSGGSLIATVAAAPYSYTWVGVPAGTYSLSARATDNEGNQSPLVWSPVVVSDLPPPPSGAPSVIITSPAQGTSSPAASTLAVTASATDSDGIVTAVDFYANGVLIGSDTTAPYGVDWFVDWNGAGTYSLTAVAHDNSGATTTSQPVTVTITEAEGRWKWNGTQCVWEPHDTGIDQCNPPPSVSVTTPAPGSTFTAPATITLTASATDPNGSISKVEFFLNGNLLATDTAEPYTYTWTDVHAGTYSITARATDDGGATADSVDVAVSVVNAGPLPGTGTAWLSANGELANSGGGGGIASNGGDFWWTLVCTVEIFDPIGPVTAEAVIEIDGNWVAQEGAVEGWDGYAFVRATFVTRAANRDRRARCIGNYHSTAWGPFSAADEKVIPGSGPASGELRISTFIPYNWVGNPENIYRIFAGDNRGFTPYGATSRAVEVYDVANPATNDVDDFGSPSLEVGWTEEYDGLTSLDAPMPFGLITPEARADWVWGPPLKTRWDLASTSTMACAPPQRLGPIGAFSTNRVRCFGAVSNPLVGGAPDIDWDFTFTFQWGENHIHYVVEGCHDEFPAFEADLNGKPLFQHSDNGNVSSLFQWCGHYFIAAGDIW